MKRIRAWKKRQPPTDPNEYCNPPRLLNGRSIWREYAEEPSKHATGLGIFPKLLLRKKFSFPYCGVWRTEQERRSMAKHNNEGKLHRNSHVAQYEGINADGKLEMGIVDAHPDIRVAMGYPRGAWPGSCCNQANRVEDVNAELVQHDGYCAAPVYPYTDERCNRLFIRLLRDVQVGEEILVDYGYSKRQQTIWGFGPDAKSKIRVASDYSLRKKDKAPTKYGVETIFE